MNEVFKISTIAIIATFLTAASPAIISTNAFAIEGDYKRFKICKQLQSTNSVKWHGIASGTIDDAFAIFEHSRSFHTRACFSNQKTCNIWLKRIWWEIPTMDELRTVYCKRV